MGAHAATGAHHSQAGIGVRSAGGFSVTPGYRPGELTPTAADPGWVGLHAGAHVN